MGHSNKDQARSHLRFKAPTTSVASVGNVRLDRPECKHCGKRHLGSCRLNDRACFKCGSQEHFIQNCPKMAQKEQFSSARPSNTTNRGRKLRNMGNRTSSKGMTKDTVVRSEARAPSRAYAIRAREDVPSPM